MNKHSRKRGLLFWGLMAGLMGLAVAHHGNPQAPAPDWQGSLPPTAPTPAPDAPAQPGG